MNNLYLIGGAERCGKTTILHKFIKAKPVIAIQTDAIRDSIEKVLFDEMEIIAPIGHISFSGDVVFRSLVDDSKREDVTKHFSKNIPEGELVWNAIVGLISHYDKPSRLITKGSTEKSIDLIIEGIEVTPKRVNDLITKNFLIKPVFVGYTEDTSFEKTLIQFEKEGFNIDNKEFIKEKHDEHVEKGKGIAMDADKYGYKFFSFDNNDFEKYCSNILDYLLSE